MKTNMGSADKIIRVLIASIIAILFFANVIHGVVAMILLILAGVFILTSIFGFCPIYLALGISTCGNKLIRPDIFWQLGKLEKDL